MLFNSDLFMNGELFALIYLTFRGASWFNIDMNTALKSVQIMALMTNARRDLKASLLKCYSFDSE